MRTRACGHGERGHPLGKGGGHRHPGRPPHSREAQRLLLHRRDRPRHQHPSAGRVDGAARARAWPLSRGGPGRVVELRRLPAPGVDPGVHAIAGAGHVVLEVDLFRRHRQRRVGGVAHALPGLAAIDGLLALAVALEEEAGLVRLLRLRRVHAEVPDDRGQRVAPRLQEGREVERLVPPVVEVAARRPPGHTRAVDEELVPVVGRHVDEEAGRLLAELERPAEVVDPVIEGGCALDGDPARGPRAAERRGQADGRRRRRARSGQQHHAHSGTHRASR